MKKKNNIIPPSKDTITVDKVEKRVEKLIAQREELNALIEADAKYLEADRKFEECVLKTSKILGVNEGDLSDAFKNKKSELTANFHNIKNPDSMLFGVYATFSALSGYFIMTSGLTLRTGAYFAVVNAFTVALGVAMKKERAKVKKARTVIANEVTQHQNRLPDMTAPKVG